MVLTILFYGITKNILIRKSLTSIILFRMGLFDEGSLDRKSYTV